MPPRTRHKASQPEPIPTTEPETPKKPVVPGQFPASALILALFTIRLVNSFTINTFFQPDEYYQALEPAHYLVYGYGYVTWEWKEHLRSSIHPLIYALGYKIVKTFTTDSEWVFRIPKIIGAIIATGGDYGMYRFAFAYTRSEKLAGLALILWVLNPFNWYVLTRAFSNSFETVLTIAGFAYWPWEVYRGSTHFSYGNYAAGLAFAIVSCIVRPTNAIVWAYLGIYLLIKLQKNRQFLFKLLVVSVVELAAILTVNTYVDYIFYGQVTFPLVNFLQFNVVRNLSVFYGVAPWHFYLFQAIPLMTMLYLPFLLHSLVARSFDVLIQAGSLVLVGFSLIDHKEFRFIYPLQPIMILQCAYSIDILRQKWTATRLKAVLAVVVTVHALIAYFFTRVNESGILSLVEYLRDPSVESVGFLTPCHSTPWQSHLHQTKFEANSTWFLTCEPPLNVPLENYRDESDQFYDDPVGFLHQHMPRFGSEPGASQKPWPSHLVMFEHIQPVVGPTLASEYEVCQEFFNSYFHWDPRREGNLVVYCKKTEQGI